MNVRIFALGGAILIVSGILQVLVRPRAPKEKAAERFINRSVLRAVLFVLVGVVAVLVGMGVIPVAWASAAG
jgi:uncharacterized membrane protein